MRFPVFTRVSKMLKKLAGEFLHSLLGGTTAGTFGGAQDGGGSGKPVSAKLADRLAQAAMDKNNIASKDQEQLDTALFRAIEDNNPDKVKSLLNQGANVNARRDDIRLTTPLHTATQCAAETGDTKVLELILDQPRLKRGELNGNRQTVQDLAETLLNFQGGKGVKKLINNQSIVDRKLRKNSIDEIIPQQLPKHPAITPPDLSNTNKIEIS